MTQNPPSYKLTDEQRAAIERLAAKDTSFTPIAEMLLQLDDTARQSPDNSPSRSSRSRAS